MVSSDGPELNSLVIPEVIFEDQLESLLIFPFLLALVPNRELYCLKGSSFGVFSLSTLLQNWRHLEAKILLGCKNFLTGKSPLGFLLPSLSLLPPLPHFHTPLLVIWNIKARSDLSWQVEQLLGAKLRQSMSKMDFSPFVCSLSWSQAWIEKIRILCTWVKPKFLNHERSTEKKGLLIQPQTCKLQSTGCWRREGGAVAEVPIIHPPLH